ncbi:hypothetical protein [Clostridium botulinum]|uniref:hypothetical protein n=1 Tax=Clostridium botulinum TaxID=1491 RepID=UPI0004D79D44|nr:hypothetical protein [Clostridium botulinum]KEH99818.1 hypothetical protein Z952_p0147 [Clostridium botulinum C/D str. BKT75002]KEI05296.1 hypothetical protein Z954_0148 [Clostridium botulinum C/D str. BKT2873]QPW61987.1 hypothetical protein IG390_14120 [Clostridium botulinum]
MDFNSLKNNSIVLTGFQFIEHNPLGFFEFDDTSKQRQLFNNRQEGNEASGKLVFKNDGFAPTKDDKGHTKAKEDILVVSRAKSRPVLIFQDIEFSKQYHDNVFVIPIQTLKEPILNQCTSRDEYKQREREYKAIIERSEEFYHLYYIPVVRPNGQPWNRILMLKDARFVHISSLFGQVKENEISEDEISEIGIRLGKMLNIEKLEKCNECIYNYENYIQDKEEDDAIRTPSI